jgi:hypothetical protein
MQWARYNQVKPCGVERKQQIMIDGTTSVRLCQKLVITLEADLRGRVDGEPDVRERFEQEWRTAVDANRTGQTFDVWVGDRLTQIAVAWVLGCVFVRFCEDNGLIEEARIAGAGDKADEAAGHYERYFRANPGHGDCDYLKRALRSASTLPGLTEVLEAKHNPLWQLDPSTDAATALLGFYRATSPATGALVLDFTDPQLDTRFLGDLYQDLSESARDRYALLQTPIFVEEFILDRTLTPAIAAFGLPDTSVIDPTCGSGHFLLGAFDRLIRLWLEREPGTGVRVLVQRALDQVAGVDLNPFAVAIARFRMLVAACKVAEVRVLRTAPDYTTHIVAGDSLLFGRREAHGQTAQFPEMEATLEGKLGPRELGALEVRRVAGPSAFYYETEDPDIVRKILDRRYAAVVGNPPYIVSTDPALSRAYRARFKSCYKQYSLAVPFLERFFELAIPGSPGRASGYVGQITSNSFMKKEFGKNLVERFIPGIDLTNVIDTSGANIAGHETSTVILFGRNQRPQLESVLFAMGKLGGRTQDNSAGQSPVWRSIVEHHDLEGSENEYLSVFAVSRRELSVHPWSVSGQNESILFKHLESTRAGVLDDLVSNIGRTGHTGADEAYFAPLGTWRRSGISDAHVVRIGEGSQIRDWQVMDRIEAIFPYDANLLPTLEDQAMLKILWPSKQFLVRRREPNGTHEEIGLSWFEWSRFHRDRYRHNGAICFAFQSTANHFVLDVSRRVFKQTAPAIRLLSAISDEEEVWTLLAGLNSSITCFWIHQVVQAKDRSSEPYKTRFEIDSTKIRRLPLPPKTMDYRSVGGLLSAAEEISRLHPAAICRSSLPTSQALSEHSRRERALRSRLISLQEEVDWDCMHRFGMVRGDLTSVGSGVQVPDLSLGERAFEIDLARRMRSEGLETEWFRDNGSRPLTELPDQWSDEYKSLVSRRLEAIATDRSVSLVERPEYKRRWSIEPWDVREKAALRSWLLDRLEARSLWFEGEDPRLLSVARLADRLSTDADFMAVVRLYEGQSDVRIVDVIRSLVADEVVPLQSACRYKDTGVRKRRDWERTWDLQRAEDRGEDVGKIPVPPKYDSKDFVKKSFWKLRGELDVPKERFVHVAHAERENDASMVIGWAGWDHLQQAMALSAYVIDRQDRDGWDGAKCLPVLVAIQEMLPWVRQWHPEVNPMIGESMGDYLTNFVQETANSFGLTSADLASWQPPVSSVRKPRKSKA